MCLIFRNKTKLTHWLIPAFVSFFSILGSPTAVAQDIPFIEQVRFITTENLGISNPIGLAYLSHTQTLLIGQADQSLDNSYELIGVSLLEDLAGSQAINTDISNPTNISFDPYANRLLLLNVEDSHNVLIVLETRGNSDLDRLERFDATSFGLENPQGMTVDPMSGTVFILDAAGPSIVHVEPNQDGSFNNAKIVEIDLSVAGLNNLQGIAFNPNDGYLYVLDTIKQNLVALTLDGQIQSTRDLSKFKISNPENMVFAPSGDLTDDDSEMSLYINNNAINGVTPGIAELTLIPPQIILNNQVVSSQAITNVVATMAFKVETFLYNPPSPDPSGIGYLPDSNSLLISDGEVGEAPVGGAPVIFEGFNLFETDLDGNLINTSSTSTQTFLDSQGLSSVETANFSDEPTGVSEVNPLNNHIFISDDDDDDIYEVDPAGDSQYGTSDDIITSFSTRDFIPSSGDPEGVTYAVQLGDLFIADGLNSEIYRVSPGNDGIFHTTSDNVVTHFDTEQHGLQDPEGITYFPTTGNLLVISNNPRDTLFELTTSGDLVREIDFSVAVENDLRKPAGLALAPPDAQNPNTTCVYLVDRADDNNSVPGENDGLLFKMCFPTGDVINNAPTVNAGADQSITLPDSVSLDGTVGDDGRPSPPGVVTITWSKVSGPGVVGFDSADAEDTIANFSTAGTYILRLTANDSEFQTSDEITITVTDIGGGSATTIERRVTASSDDAEESSKGNIKVADNDLELVFDKSIQTVGMRFINLSIPLGSVITNAYLQFEAAESKPNNSTTLTIEGEAVTNADTFTSAKHNISARPRTTASTPWSPAPWTSTGDAGPDQQTPNISTIIQEIIDQGSTTVNSIVLIISGTGERTAESFEGKPAAAPLLHIEYTSAPTSNQAPAVNAGTDQTIALSTDATLNAMVTDDDLPSPTSLTTLWTKTSGPVSGTVDFGIATDIDTTANFSEAGIYVLRLTANDSEFQTSDEITITVTDIGGGSTTTIEKRVTASSDDAEESSSGKIKLADSDLELIYDKGNQTVGMRFIDLDIPAGSIVTNAYLQFNAAEFRPNNTTTLTIEGEAVANAVTFTSVTEGISSRLKTATSTQWMPSPWETKNEAGLNQRTPDISAIIQEIIGLPGWGSGNSAVVIINGTGERTAESYEGKPAAAPLLHVEFISPAL